MKKEQFNVEGMGCVNCGKTIQNTLNELNGVNEASVNFERKIANVEYDETLVDKGQLQAAVKEAGYQLITD